MDRDRGAQSERVLTAVLDAIRSGTYAPNGRLPSESALGELYGVHRSTVRRAVEILRWTGLITGPAGGTARVAPEPQRSMALAVVEMADKVRTMNRRLS